MQPDAALDTLLELHGSVIDQENGYRVKASPQVPHGARYSLTLHQPNGRRILGYDNAHAVKPARKYKYAEGGAEKMKAIVIGIMPQEQIRARVLAIARGEYKPKPNELVHFNGIPG